MGFDDLLGNARLKENLNSAILSGRMSHFYLICGPKGAGKRMLARLLAAAAVCENADKPCGHCNACRKAMANTHPDIITVDDSEHKSVAVKIVRDARESMFIRPNEAEKKVYIFPQELGIEGQNALLKVLEEPPSYGVFLILSENPETLLPTVRSRCVPLSLNALGEEELRPALQKAFPAATQDDLQAAIVRSGGYLGQAKALLFENAQRSAQTEAFTKAFASRDVLALTELLVPMEKWKREAFLEEINAWSALLWEAIAYRSSGTLASAQAQKLANTRSAAELMQAYRELQKAAEYVRDNVSVAAICGNFAWTLR